MKVINYDAVMDSYERRLKRIIEQTDDRFCEQAERLRFEMQVLDKQIKFYIDDSLHQSTWICCDEGREKVCVCAICENWGHKKFPYCPTCHRKMRNADEDFSR